MSQRHSFIALDALRGLAAVAVMLSHIRGSSWVEFGALPTSQHTPAIAAFFLATRLGKEAVMVFFVLSGFLVGGRLLQRLQSGTFQPRSYVVDRVSRIILPLAPAVLLTAVLAGLAAQAPPALDVAGNLVGLNGILVPTLANNGPLWSLAYEIWFYVLAGALAVLVSRGWNLAAALCILAAALAFTRLDPLFLLFWCGGALGVFLLRTRRPRVLGAVGFTLAVVGVAAMQIAHGSRSITQIHISEHLGEAVLCAGCVIALPLLCRPRINSLLMPLAAPIGSLSAASYTLYLVHFPIDFALGGLLPQASAMTLASWSAFAARLGICSAVTVVFYLVFERNTAIVRRWLSPRAAAPTAA